MAKHQTAPSNSGASADLGEELRYLKWDLGRFLQLPSTDLLPAETKGVIEQVMAWIVRYTANPTDVFEPAPGLDLLKAAFDHIRHNVNDYSQPDTEGDRQDTPRERLLRSELTRALDRITLVMSLLRKTLPSKDA